MFKKIVLWILVIACMSAIFIFSSQKAEKSDRTSSGFVEKIVRFLDFDDSLEEAEIAKIVRNINHLVRKTAHFSIYAMLGFLLSLLLKQYCFYGKRQLWSSTGISFLYACSDEIHQYFVPGRSAQVSDVLLDTAGAFCGALFAVLITIIILRVKENKNGF